ncbi:hypothetical protein JK364_51095 [Streptomyces sp. 110]|uniref:Integral membrane protein n=1 Tax=Streptomyces endocoffeicus TaxID=2898945 RepID=A0ABS1Q7D2_9ACTN|nr:hypothetical protein [Streptomyces endocoffeicus]MBL1120583.1 hypothetical protein [Streptomyces endocoffeicus]
MSSQQQPGWNNAGQGGPVAHGPSPYGEPQPYQPYPNGGAVPGGHQPQPMPGPVRAAQVLFFVMSGLGLLGMALAIATDHVEAAGSIFATSLPAFLGLISALRFSKRKPGSRGTATITASLMIIVGLGTLGQGQPAGLILGGVGIAIVILLSQQRSGHWFGRPART